MIYVALFISKQVNICNSVCGLIKVLLTVISGNFLSNPVFFVTLQLPDTL